MSRHTPGPWEAIKGIQFFKVVTADCSMVADCGSVSAPTYRDEFEANSFLMAAAPQLLEALKSLLEAVCGEQRDPEEIRKSLGVHAPYAVELAEQAISLAERGAE